MIITDVDKVTQVLKSQCSESVSFFSMCLEGEQVLPPTLVLGSICIGWVAFYQQTYGEYHCILVDQCIYDGCHCIVQLVPYIYIYVVGTIVNG